MHILILVCCYAVLALAMDLLAGHTGLLTLSHAALAGVGGYSSALLAIHAGTSFLVSTVAGMLLAAILSIVVALPSLRLEGDYFVIATLGFQLILHSIFMNWTSMTGGSAGLADIPVADFISIQMTSKFRYLLLAITLTIITYAITRRITTSPFGRVLRAIREDEVFAQSVGKNVMQFKVAAFAVAAALAASAGSLYGHYVTFIDPTNFTAMESIAIISMVVIGGVGSSWGPIIGAVVLVSLPEALRFAGFPVSVAANLRQITYGVLLIVMMRFRPRGLVGTYSFGR